jgi:WD40 repeat protein/serine/threonine protein kinase
MSKCLNESDIQLLVAGAKQLDVQGEEHLADCFVCRKAVQSQRADADLFLAIKQAFDDDGEAEPFLDARQKTDSDSSVRVEAPIEGYQILSELHRGGQGVVYKAVQKATKRTVALKLMLQGAHATPRQRLRFEREIDLVASLKHPNIVTVYDSGLSHGRLFYAMEYIDGQPLDRFMHSFGAAEQDHHSAPPILPIPHTLRLFHKICAAVSYAQQRGVIHRDLKPANILIDSTGEPHVLDFGLAKPIDEEFADDKLTAAGEFLGTLAYASPEQASADPHRIDVRSDVYSLGVILFEMLTGTLPYSVAGPLSDVLRQITDTAPRGPSNSRRDVDAEIDSITLKALAKEPERRYQSADHLARDIEHYLKNEPIDAKRDSTWYLFRKSLRRHRGPVVTAASFAFIIAAALVVSLYFWHQAVADRDSAKKSELNEKAARIAETEAKLAEKKQRIEAEFQAYIANVAAADQALRGHDILEARQRLERAPERLRNWEWFHLQQRLDASRQTLQGHTSYVYEVAFSPNGEWLASADWTGTVRLWNARSGSLQREFQVTHSLTSLQFSPDGKFLGAAGKDPKITIWNTSDGRLEVELVGPLQQVRGMAFSADSQLLASTHGYVEPSAESNGLIVVWNIASHLATTTHSAPRTIGNIIFHPGGGIIAIAAGRQIELRNATTGLALQVLPTLAEDGPIVNDIDFSPDGLRLVSAWNDGVIRVWDPNSNQNVKLAQFSGHTESAEDIAFSKDGTRIASASRDKTVRLWDAATGAALAVFCGHTWTVTSVAFSPDGQSVASASWDNTVKLWDATKLDDVATLRGHTQHTAGIAIHPDGTRIASSSWDKTVRLWDATTLKSVATFVGHEGPVQCVAINPARGASRWLASGSWDQTIRLWKPDAPDDVRILRGHTDRVQGLTFSPDGKWLISGSRDNTIRFWDAESGEPHEMLTGHTDHIHCVAFSPNGRILASSGHQTIKLWNVETRAEVATLPRTIVQEDYSLAFHPGGRLLAAGSDSRMLFVWDLERLEPVAKLPNHTDEIMSVSFTSDGTRLASASVDGTVRIWDVATWTEITTLSGFSARVNSIVFSGDDSCLVGGLRDGTIKIWKSAMPNADSMR